MINAIGDICNNIKDIFVDDEVKYESPEKSMQAFYNLLPYRVYDELDKIYINDDSYGFILEGPPLCSAGQDTVTILSSLFTEGVPDRCAIQIINWASPCTNHYYDAYLKAREVKGGIYKKLAESRVEFYKDAGRKSLLPNPFLIREFRVFYVISVSSDRGNEGKEVLKTFRKQLSASLESIGIKTENLEANELLGLVDELLLGNTSNTRSRMKWDKINPLHEHLINHERSWEISADGVKVNNNGDKFEIRNFVAMEFADRWAQWNNVDLIGDFYSDYAKFPCPFLTTLTLFYGDESASADYAQFKLLRAIQANKSGFARFMPMIAQKEQDWRLILDQVHKGQKFIKGIYQVFLYSKEDEAEENERSLRSLYSSKAWNLQKMRTFQMQGFLSMLPFMASEGYESDLKKCGKIKSIVTCTASNIAPLQGEWTGVNSAKMMLLGRRGQPMFFDPFANPMGNYNTNFVGKSGSGKSVNMQELVSSLLGSGGQVIILDDGRSFMNSCLLQGGKFIEFSHDHPICINPFSIIDQREFEENASYKEEFIQLLNLIIRQMCRTEERTSDLENSLIQEAIFYVLKERANKGSVSDVATYLANLSDVRAKDMAKMLFPFTANGIYNRYFEGRATLNLDDNFFLFEFENLRSKPELQRIVLMIVMFLVFEKMFRGDRKRTISLVIDEAWKLLEGGYFAEFIEGIARRARKYNGNLITGTQSVDDFYKNPAALAVYQNSDWLCLLSQSRESIDAMKKSDRVKLDPEMEKALISLKTVNNQYSEMLIYNSSIGWAVGRLILDPKSIAVYSSKGDDFARIQQLKSEGYSLEEAIDIAANKIKQEQLKRG